MIVKLVGDIMLGELLENYRRGVASRIAKGIDPFEHCRRDLANSDLSVGNLECVISDRSDQKGLFRQILRAPHKFAFVLKQSGITAVNIANNHALDHGPEALLDTIGELQSLGITVFGGGPPDLFQTRPVIREFENTKIALLGYNLANYAPTRFADAVTSICRILHETNREVPFVLLSVHWGQEYADCPEPVICDAAERFLAAGAKIVYGHHSHRLQGHVLSAGRLFAPSLGNFVFDDSRRENRLTAILTLEVESDEVRRVEAQPYFINRHFQPVPEPTMAHKTAELNLTLRGMMEAQASEQEALTRRVRQVVALGHLKNRIRMRILMILNWYRYLGHFRFLWRYLFEKDRRRYFSVTDSDLSERPSTV